MASNSLHYSIQHHHSIMKRHNPLDTHTPTSLFLKPHTPPIHPNIAIWHNTCNSHITYSVSQTTTTSPTTPSLDLLRHHLSTKNFQQADEETRRLLIVLAGEGAQKRGYVFFSEVKFISERELRSIDKLWREHSGDKFGYSVQKRILEKANGDMTKFFIKVGWMKKLETEIEQYNYKSFPSEFIWELNDDTPEGHLPLTNALRGTQLLTNLLNHPAFYDNDNNQPPHTTNASSSNTLPQRIFKPDYTF